MAQPGTIEVPVTVFIDFGPARLAVKRAREHLDVANRELAALEEQVEKLQNAALTERGITVEVGG